MRFKRTAAAVLAAVTAVSAASVCAFAEENKAELATLDFADVHGMTKYSSLGDGYILYYDDSNYIRGIVHLEKNDNGELTYTDVETDLDFSKNITWWSGESEYLQLSERDTENNVTKRHVVHIDKANNKATTVYTPPVDWCYTRGDGYSICQDNGPFLKVYEPDGTVHEIGMMDGFRFYTYAISDLNGKYVGYALSLSDSDPDVRIESPAYGTTRDIIFYGIGKDGSRNKLYVAKNVIDCDFCAIGSNYFVINEQYVNDAESPLSGRWTLYLTEEDKVVNNFNFWGSSGGNRIYNNKLMKTRPEGESNMTAGLIDVTTNEYCNDNGYLYIGTEDEGKTYLVESMDEKWGFLDADGNEIGEWFDDAGEFRGDYAPVIKDGKAYLVDRNFNRVSEMVNANEVETYSDDMFLFANGDEVKFVTYNGAASAPADTSKPDDTSKPSDSTSTPSAEKDNPETGAKGVALTLGLAAIAGAAAVVYRKKK